MPLAHAVEIDALTLEGADGPAPGRQLSAMRRRCWMRPRCGSLAEGWFAALAALVRHAARAGAGGRSPSDLPLVELTQDEIERLERRYGGAVEDILPLSPLQEGLLFHALYDGRGPDVYTVQLELELEGPLDAALLQAAMRGRDGSARKPAGRRSGTRALSGPCRWWCAARRRRGG